MLAIHEHSGEVGVYLVSDLIVTDGAATNAVTLFHDTGDSETLDVTDEHPFWIESRGDARGPAPAGWARADTLAPGDTVRTLAGLARVETVAAEARRQRVHNLSIADARTFLVGDGGAWVHNCDDIIVALASGVVNKSHHNWERMFGRKPGLDEVTLLLMSVAHTDDVEQDFTHREGKSVRKIKQVQGFIVWADVFYNSKTGKYYLTNGGIR